MSDGARLLSSIQSAFARIGHTNGTKFPEERVVPQKGASNEEVDALIEREKAVYEYMVASELATAAATRRKRAEQECSRMNVFDAVTQLKPGGSGVIHHGPVVIITATIAQPAQTLDKAALRVHMAKDGISAAKVDDWFKKATKLNKPATKIVAATTL